MANWLSRQQPHPDSFVCGVRPVDGAGPRKTLRWQYQRSAVDQLIPDGVVTLYHGTKETLRLRMDPSPFVELTKPRARQGLVVLSGTTVESRLRLLVAVPMGEVIRFGLTDL